MITALIQKIARRLDASHIPYMIIGGQAVLLYGRPRLTRDIDMTLGIDTDQFHLLEALCHDLGLRMLPENPRDFAEKTKVLPAEDTPSKVRVDFIFSFTAYEAQAMDRANGVPMEGYPVRFAACEDVIIHKMIAARAVDAEDVYDMLAKQRERLDLNYLRHWLSQFSTVPEHEDILHRFEALLEE